MSYSLHEISVVSSCVSNEVRPGTRAYRVNNSLTKHMMNGLKARRFNYVLDVDAELRKLKVAII